MNHSINKITAVLVPRAFLGGTLVHGSAAQAQIDFSSLQQWRAPGAQRRAVEGVRRANAPPAATSSDADDRRAEEERQERNRKRAERLQVERKEYEAQTAPVITELSGLTESTLRAVRLQPTVELKPSVMPYFDVPADLERKPFGPIIVAEVKGIGTPASQIPDVDLNRAAAILAPMAQAGELNNMSDEDMGFLAGQAALALEGAPLSVRIVGVTVGHKAQVRRLVQKSQDVDALQKEFEHATGVAKAIEKDLWNVQYQLNAGSADPAALQKKRDALLVSYKSAYTDANEKRSAVQERMGTITYKEEPRK